MSFVTWYPNWRHSRLSRWAVRAVEQATAEPITFEEAAMHLRLDSISSPPVYDDQALVEMQISAAREFCEAWLGRSLAPQVLEWRGSSFPTTIGAPYDSITLPLGPVRGVQSVSYINSAGAEIILGVDEYQVDLWDEPAQLYPSYNGQFPMARMAPGAVRIRYHAGYTLGTDSPNDVPLPMPLRAAILLVLGDLYENREDSTPLTLSTLPNGAKALMRPYRLELGMA